MRNVIVVVLVVMVKISCVASAAGIDVFEIETVGSYQMESGSSIELAKKVAFFSAKKKAVELAGRYLSRKNLIETYELNRDEIYSLAAREIQAVILEEKTETAGMTSTYRLRIRARVQVSDFVNAEREDIRQEKKEIEASYIEEMEPDISAEIDPGKDIAKAYRLLREKKWRITMIYLDHLVEKYPNWDSLYITKAMTHYLLHEPVFMKKALTKACRIGNDTACDDLKKIKKLNEHDFGLSAID